MTGAPLGTVNAPRTIHRGLELGCEWRFARFVVGDTSPDTADV
jgi:hypothetical protein